MPNWTEQDALDYYRRNVPKDQKPPLVIKAKAVKRDATAKMTKPERAFTEHCEARRIVKEIEIWRFEPVTFSLADDTRYTPDVMIVHNDGLIGFFDTKAFWKKSKKVHYTQWSLAAMKMAAEMHPYFSFSMCWQDETGEWKYRHFLPRGCK